MFQVLADFMLGSHVVLGAKLAGQHIRINWIEFTMLGLELRWRAEFSSSRQHVWLLL